MSHKKDKYRGYVVGKKYRLLVTVKDEHGNIIPAGTIIRIVAIAPKVRIVEGENKDKWMYFYIAVIAEQKEDYKNRIRENFCTIKKV